MTRPARPSTTGRDKTKSYGSGREPLVIGYKDNTIILTYDLAPGSKDGLQWKERACRMLPIYTNKVAEANKS